MRLGRLSVYIFGDATKISYPDKRLASRIHDEVNMATFDAPGLVADAFSATEATSSAPISAHAARISFSASRRQSRKHKREAPASSSTSAKKEERSVKLPR